MNLDRVILHHLRMRLKAPFETSFGRIRDRECILLEVQADGLTGLGECVADRDPWYSPETVGTAWHILKDHLLPPILGRPVPTAAEFQRGAAAVRGHQMAKAGIEMALWDLWGRAQGQPLAALLGGTRPSVPVGVSIGLHESTAVLLESVASYVEAGYRRVKLKIKPGRDVAMTRAVRAVHPDLPLQVDANSAYILADAEALLPLDDLGLLLIEQPLAEDDLWDHRLLQARLRTPICLDESITAVRHASQAIEMDAARVINIKAGRVGGLSVALAIHDLCATAGIPVWCGGMLETGVGRASNLALAALPGFSLPGDISASDRYYEEDITLERFALNPDSTIDVPAASGLGVNIDRAALARATRASLPLIAE